VLDLVPAIPSAFRVFFRSRVAASLKVLALRQQIAVLKRKRPRPLLNGLDRLFWTTLRSLWPGWSDVLVIVKPQTHRTGFRLYWRWLSRRRSSRPKASDEIRALIRRMLPKVVDDHQLALIHPPGERDQHKPEWIEVTRRVVN
jgi:hypothetical protein